MSKPILTILVMALLAYLALGCVATSADDGGQDLSLGPLWHEDPTGSQGLPEPLGNVPLPWWAKGILGLGLGFAVPRTRENLIGAGQAVLAKDPKDALLHLAALTPLVHTPTAKET